MELDALLPRPGLTTGTFARVTGLSATALRSYDARGLFRPDVVDPQTRHRRYAPGQVGRGRLLAALVMTGMPVQRAARVVAAGDRSAALAHLQVVRDLLEQGRDHVPLADPDEAVRMDLGRSEAWWAPVAPGADLLDEVRAARARWASLLGAPARELGGWAPHEGLLTGPRVDLQPVAHPAAAGDGGGDEDGEAGDGHDRRPLAPVRVLLPVPAQVPDEAWEGLRVHFRVVQERRGRWWLSAPRPAERWADLLAAGGAARRVLRRVRDEGGGVLAEQRLVWDRDLVSVSLLARVHGGR